MGDADVSGAGAGPASGVQEQLSAFADAHAQMFDSALVQFKTLYGEARASLYADAMGFVHAVDLTERWLTALLAFHVALFLSIVATRHSTNAQGVLFLGIVIAIYTAEWLNGLGAARWESFAGQNYFDKHGVFMSVLWSAPLLGDAFLVIVLALRSTANLLVTVKRLELRQNRRAASSAAGQNRRAASSAAGPTNDRQKDD
ncbi:transmembrane protein 18-domain-containing protein [Pavlovales sp. CCMP2436]|nr:transmembrane protein 18-domain-containing protein [Pavlovales sp. CCMP2436]